MGLVALCGARHNDRGGCWLTALLSAPESFLPLRKSASIEAKLLNGNTSCPKGTLEEDSDESRRRDIMALLFWDLLWLLFPSGMISSSDVWGGLDEG